MWFPENSPPTLHPTSAHSVLEQPVPGRFKLGQTRSKTAADLEFSVSDLASARVTYSHDRKRITRVYQAMRSLSQVSGPSRRIASATFVGL